MDTAQFVALCANASDSNITSELWLIQDKTRGQIAAAFILLLLVIGLPWNLIVAVTILKQKLFKQPTIMLLLNLILTDLTMILTVLPFQVVTGLRGEFGLPSMSNAERCQTCQAGVATTIFITNTLFTISFMSFDRFLYIYKPLRYDKLITPTRVLIILIVAWILSTIVAILPLVGFGSVVFVPNILTCSAALSGAGTATSGAFTVFLFVIYSILILLLLVFNLCVVFIAMRNIRAVYKVRRSLSGGRPGANRGSNELYKNVKRKRREKELRLVKVFGGLLFASLVSWLPAIVLIIAVAIAGTQDIFPPAVYTFIQLVFVFQVVTHPFVETAIIKEVRDPIKNVLCCCKYSGSDSDTGCCGYLGDDRVTSNGCGCSDIISTALLPSMDSSQHEPSIVTKTKTPISQEMGGAMPQGTCEETGHNSHHHGGVAQDVGGATLQELDGAQEQV